MCVFVNIENIFCGCVCVFVSRKVFVCECVRQTLVLVCAESLRGVEGWCVYSMSSVTQNKT